MLVLLPPSEGKASPDTGPSLKLAALSLPDLTDARETVLTDLIELCAADEEKAREVLGLSEGQRPEIAKNATLRSAPTSPAAQTYTGVLYDALDLATLSPTAHTRAEQSLLIFSGLWGAVRITDPIPSYRCSGGVKLPALGGLGAYWRPHMDTVLPRIAADDLILDLRSTAYAAMWRPKKDLAARTATVRVLHSKIVNGVEKRSVVSHFNKATKGRIVRSLLEADTQPRTPTDLAETLRALGHTVEYETPHPNKPWQLDVIVTELH